MNSLSSFGRSLNRPGEFPVFHISNQPEQVAEKIEGVVDSSQVAEHGYRHAPMFACPTG